MGSLSFLSTGRVVRSIGKAAVAEVTEVGGPERPLKERRGRGPGGGATPRVPVGPRDRETARHMLLLDGLVEGRGDMADHGRRALVDDVEASGERVAGRGRGSRRNEGHYQ